MTLERRAPGNSVQHVLDTDVVWQEAGTVVGQPEAMVSNR